MAVKIFCSSCEQYIRNARDLNEIRELTGAEICTNCESGLTTLVDTVEKIAKRGIVRIERARDDILAKIEDAKRKVIKEDVQS